MKKSLISLAATAAALATPHAFATDYEVTVTNLTRGMHFTPLLLAAHSADAQIFAAGTQASAELQAVAEGGDTTALGALLDSVTAAVVTGDGLVAPASSATFTISNTGSPDNTQLSLVGMLLPTNDGFVGVNAITLPQGEVGTSITADAVGYDAGTEANDERVGSGASGEAGFPNPPPVQMSGTGTGASGVQAMAEGFVHVHRNVLGDTDPSGGISDIDSRIHRWLNPVARVSVTITGN